MTIAVIELKWYSSLQNGKSVADDNEMSQLWMKGATFQV